MVFSDTVHAAEGHTHRHTHTYTTKSSSVLCTRSSHSVYSSIVSHRFTASACCTPRAYIIAHGPNNITHGQQHTTKHTNTRTRTHTHALYFAYSLVVWAPSPHAFALFLARARSHSRSFLLRLRCPLRVTLRWCTYASLSVPRVAETPHGAGKKSTTTFERTTPSSQSGSCERFGKIRYFVFLLPLPHMLLLRSIRVLCCWMSVPLATCKACPPLPTHPRNTTERKTSLHCEGMRYRKMHLATSGTEAGSWRGSITTVVVLKGRDPSAFFSGAPTENGSRMP